MSDITKCPGYSCPWRVNCKRFTAQANQFRQSWYMEMPGYYVSVSKTGGPLSDERAEWRCDRFLQHESRFPFKIETLSSPDLFDPDEMNLQRPNDYKIQNKDKHEQER
jgi:hypothetical protein